MSEIQTRRYSAAPENIEVRDPDGVEGVFRVRLPLSSTTEARDGDAFSRKKLEGFRDQINDDGSIGVFIDHGRNFATGSRYSATGKAGRWRDASVEDRDGTTVLVADAELLDPREVDADLGALGTHLSTIRAQADQGVPLSVSVGWRDDTGDRDLPGDTDLMEASLVGIPSDEQATAVANTDPAGPAGGAGSSPETVAARGVASGRVGVAHAAATAATRAVARLVDDDDVLGSGRDGTPTDSVPDTPSQSDGDADIDGDRDRDGQPAGSDADHDRLEEFATSVDEFVAATDDRLTRIEELFADGSDGRDGADSDPAGDAGDADTDGGDGADSNSAGNDSAGDAGDADGGDDGDGAEEGERTVELDGTQVPASEALEELRSQTDVDVHELDPTTGGGDHETPSDADDADTDAGDADSNAIPRRNWGRGQ